jgi:enoyl-CoA hydratase
MPDARLEVSDGIAVLTLDRPPVNAVELGLLGAAEARLGELDETAARALVVTGAGRCFSAGVDLKAVPAYGPAEQRAMVEGINAVVGRLYALPIPVVAAVNGHAIAGGLVLALACDYRVGVEGAAQIGLTEGRAGIPFPAVAMAVVCSELAPPVARRLVLVAQNVSPPEALRDGVLDEIQPPGEVLPRARAVAADLAAIPREAYARIKRQLRERTLAEIEAILRTGRDPMLEGWLGAETRTASASLLRGRQRSSPRRR